MATPPVDRPVVRDPRRLRPALAPILPFVRPYKAAVAGAFTALVFTAGCTLAIGQGLKFMIDRGLATGSPEMLRQSVGWFLVVVVLMAAGTFTRFFLVSWLGERVSADLRRAVFDHVVELEPAFFETNSPREIQTRITADTTLLETVIGSSVSIALRNLLTFLGGLVLLFVTDPELTGTVLACVPLVIAPILIFGRRVRRLSRASQDRVADVGAFVGETLGSIKIVQAHNHEPLDRAAFGMRVESAFAAAVRRIRQRAVLTTVVIVLVLGAVGFLIWQGGNDVLAGRISGGELAAFVFYAIMVGGAVGAISEVYGDLQRAAGATERLTELLAVEPRIASPAAPRALAKPVRGALAIQDIRFAYPSRPESPALADLSLEIAAGERIAVVGPSGAGKSTLFELLLRFYDPARGSILLDGLDLRELALDELRRHVALVPQQPTLFSTTVAENIRYGRPDATDAEVRAAADAAYASEFIDRLPEGYASHLGEGGVRLSGGQRQRMAIARALLRNPEVLLLDEATSALDAESEAVVQRALDVLMRGRTSIVIAHRLATVVDADRTVVLDQGRLVAVGTHAELLRSCALYARLAELQFSDVAA
jgi:ATP-binding cassette subfamily B protein